MSKNKLTELLQLAIDESWYIEIRGDGSAEVQRLEGQDYKVFAFGFSLKEALLDAKEKK